MRYFFIAYQALNRTSNGPSIGNYYFPANGFPSNKEIKESIFNHKDNSSVLIQTSIIITSLYEFKTSEDFYAFKGNNDEINQ